MVKLAGENRYLARSQSYERGSYFELWGDPKRLEPRTACSITGAYAPCVPLATGAHYCALVFGRYYSWEVASERSAKTSKTPAWQGVSRTSRGVWRSFNLRFTNCMPRGSPVQSYVVAESLPAEQEIAEGLITSVSVVQADPGR